jgi:hypothetical protein
MTRKDAYEKHGTIFRMQRSYVVSSILALLELDLKTAIWNENGSTAYIPGSAGTYFGYS